MATIRSARHLLGVGNPLLDLSVRVSKQVLDRYSLQENSQYLAEPQHKQLFADLAAGKLGKCSLLPGGATLNSMRVAKWLLGDSADCTFIGRVGGDAAGQQLSELISSSGVQPALQFGNEEEATGCCAALLTGTKRTLVTELGAALKFSPDQLQQQQAGLVARATHVYIGGYLFTSSVAAVDWLLQQAAAANARVAMNLHATFLCEHFVHRLQHIDILFGNEQEAHTLAKIFAASGDQQFANAVARQQRLIDIASRNGVKAGISAEYLAELAELTVAKLNNDGNNNSSIVVFTNGSRPFASAASSSNSAQILQPNVVSRDLISDTNGCGDAFVGGYLAASLFTNQNPLCEQLALATAAAVAQQEGCTLPQVVPDRIASLFASIVAD